MMTVGEGREEEMVKPRAGFLDHLACHSDCLAKNGSGNRDMSIGQEAFRGQISQSHLFEFIVRWSGVSPASQFVLGRHDLVPKSWFRFQLGRRGYVVKNLIEDELVGGESRMEKSGLLRLDDEGMLGEKVGQGLVKRVTRF